jgi:hypothetical protein
MNFKILISSALIFFSAGLLAQPSPRPINQTIDKKFIETFLKENPSYRLMENSTESVDFSSPLPNKVYTRGGYTPDKPSEFHIYTFNKRERTVDEVMIDVECDEKKFTMSQPDAEGKFRIIVWDERMPPPFIEAYCNRNWSSQVRAARREVRTLFGLPN